MGTTWGDLATWSELDLWWIPNAIQGAATATTSAVASAGGSTIGTGATAALVAAESFAAAARVAVAHSGNVVEGTATASALVITTHSAAAAAEVTASAAAGAVRIPPADVPAGALVGRIASRT